ncbi:tRNA (adenosine(37)-N6)-dimethylallyltransferase MiaA [Roseovarius salis]|uniref:tRNA (adenosine(37)-N6)-dimethylallyltransferase MiaA n=1 Tax=Roseovarius salis TaxID=3376063 RepID=UPI0037CB714E
MPLPPLSDLPADMPVLIAGPTGSGKSDLAMDIAERRGGVVVNADAIQVYANWRVLTARPAPEDEARVPHRLYGHVAHNEPYSAGRWLREVAPLLAGPDRPVIVGGTGLYFSALTEGLAQIPQTPRDIRTRAEALLAAGGIEALLAELDERTLSRIDRKNPRRVQRAWEVQQTTGHGLAAWQDATPPPLLPADACLRIVIDAPKEWLNQRLAARFDRMLDLGALDEARENLPHWSPEAPSSKAIGAAELIAHLRGEISLPAARTAAITATRQFAKRQRTWFRARMKGWHRVSAQEI